MRMKISFFSFPKASIMYVYLSIIYVYLFYVRTHPDKQLQTSIYILVALFFFFVGFRPYLSSYVSDLQRVRTSHMANMKRCC